MKTAITVLQEMMMKLGEIPEYECIAQSGPQHQATFEYRCIARGQTVTAAARSKKEAKQQAARVMLLRLGERGLTVPAPYNQDNNAPPGQSASTSAGSCSGVASSSAATVDTRSYVALLKELCEEYRLPAVDYELVGDTGPPHLRHFTVRATIGQHARSATATTKRAARQAAAEILYSYLRENLRITNDFVEEAALARAHERAMERYRESREESAARPRLEQCVADYHLGLLQAHDAEQRALAAEALSEEPAEVALACAVGALQLEAEWSSMERRGAAALHVVALAPAAPPLAFVGESRELAAAAAVRYMRDAMEPSLAVTNS